MGSMNFKPAIFQKPNASILKKEGFMCIDCHCHTNYSDGAKLDEVLKACRKKGIGVAITDHNEIKGAVEALKQKEIMVIPGMEINTSDGPHLLAYFYNIAELEDFHNKFIEPRRVFKPRMMVKLTMLETLDKLESYNCVTALAHPYAPLWTNFNFALMKNPENREVVKRVDAIEVISGLQRKISNLNARELQVLFDKAATGGSDAHSAKDVGNCLTLAETNNAEDFLEEIRKKRTIAIGKEKIRQKARLASKFIRKTIKIAVTGK